MTRLISECINVKRSELYQDYEEYVYVPKYLNLEVGDFCCSEIYEILLGENDGKCELYFGYIPQFREYFISVRAEYGAASRMIKNCPWCGKKFVKGLREEFFNTLENEFDIITSVGEYKERKDIPEEFKTDEWWKKRDL